MTEYARLFVDSVDEGLSVLGQTPKRIIYGLLESDYGIMREDLPGKFDEFSAILTKTFGPGADSILQHIINRFYAKLQLTPPEWVDLDEAVETVHRILKTQKEVNRDSGLVLSR